MNGYDLSKQYWDFAFENPEKVTPNHAALYFFAIEHCNRLGWKEKFGFPMEMAKDAIGIKNYRTYSKTFNDLVEWGFFIVHQKSKNQYSANVIALAKNTKANTKALSKALQKHSQKQVHGIVGIIKQETTQPKNKKQITEEFERFWIEYERKGSKREAFNEWVKLGIENDPDQMKEMYQHLATYKKSNAREYRKDAERYIKLCYWEGKLCS